MRALTFVSVSLFIACGGDDGDHPDAPIDAPVVTAQSYPLQSIMGGIAYMVSVQVGGQTFALDADTGSTTLGVAATACTSCAVTPKYTPGATAMDMGTTSSSTYGDGTSWSAENFSDTVELVGEGSNVNMRFGSIQMQNGFFRGNIDQGIIGFGDPIIALAGTDSFVTKRTAAGDKAEFAFQLCPTSGTMWFGGYDSSATAAGPQFSPMVAISRTQPFYEVTISKATIGTTALSLSGGAVVDTGTSVMIVPPAVETKLLSSITSSAGYTAIFGAQQLTDQNCVDPGTHTNAEIDAMLPPFTITLPGAAGNPPFTLSLPATQSYLLAQQGAMCLGVIGASGVPVILGDTVLRPFITIFDVENKQIGFAPQKGCALPPAPPRLGPPSLTPPPYFLPRLAR
ncbi:MAG TPA: pepsin-like aspartic protease [Kofleriaceae bacterium]|nr:pepsin-like aspartic protease [Kofleriaceae bacterium]